MLSFICDLLCLENSPHKLLVYLEDLCKCRVSVLAYFFAVMLDSKSELISFPFHTCLDSGWYS